jgi:hypothetical protein
MMMSKRAKIPSMMAKKMAAIACAIVMSTEPMAWKMPSIWVY